jgi:hypothetical protein
MQTVLHKDGDDFAIVTSAENEQLFRQQFAQAVAGAIDRDDLEFQLNGWMGPAIELICKYRGYKAQVIEKRTLVAGQIDPDSAIAAVGRAAYDASEDVIGELVEV